jgi:hypothetical protein
MAIGATTGFVGAGADAAGLPVACGKAGAATGAAADVAGGTTAGWAGADAAAAGWADGVDVAGACANAPAAIRTEVTSPAVVVVLTLIRAILIARDFLPDKY